MQRTREGEGRRRQNEGGVKVEGPEQAGEQDEKEGQVEKEEALENKKEEEEKGEV